MSSGSGHTVYTANRANMAYLNVSIFQVDAYSSNGLLIH